MDHGLEPVAWRPSGTTMSRSCAVSRRLAENVAVPARTRSDLGWRLRVTLGSFIAVCLFAVGFGVYATWHSLLTMPHTYSRLADHGVAATATLQRCAPGLGGGRGTACQLSMAYGQTHRTWVYPENSAQFETLPTGATIPMLIDPADPHTAYTAVDVRAQTNAGFGPLTTFGLVCLLGGVAAAAWLHRLLRTLRQPL